MIFALGVLVGIALCTFIAVLHKRYETPLQRTLQQVESKTKQKGSILEPEAEELEDWVKTLKNDKAT